MIYVRRLLLCRDIAKSRKALKVKLELNVKLVDDDDGDNDDDHDHEELLSKHSVLKS